jgi:hypothetical protein
MQVWLHALKLTSRGPGGSRQARSVRRCVPTIGSTRLPAADPHVPLSESRSALAGLNLQAEARARRQGEELPSQGLFDSNCITPGTEFMNRLDKHLKFFIRRKLATDPSWSKLKVLYSGYNVPGEGEHKIMEFIRYQVSPSSQASGHPAVLQP